MSENLLLPNLIIAGVNKGGTTSLFSYLSMHPQICPAIKKETCYFLPLRYGEKLPPLEEYSQYFRQCNNQKYVMESTPGYFYGGQSIAQAINDNLGNVKILIILREPLSRLFSFYKFKKSMVELNQNINFDEYIKQCENISSTEIIKRKNNKYWGIQGGFYVDYLENWFEIFDDNNSIKVVFFELLKSNSVQLLQEICQWLNIDDNLYNSASLEIENKTVNYNHKFFHQAALALNFTGEKLFRANPQIKKALRKVYYAINGKPHEEVMSDKTIAYLKSIYVPYNQRLATELAARGYTNLPDWLDLYNKTKLRS